MADQNQIFCQNSEKIQHFFNLLFGVIKTQFLWKQVFQKIQDGGSYDFFIPAAILDFLKNLFSTKLTSY
jgi:hypothetical protein